MYCIFLVYPYPEEVEVRVYNYNQIIARTTFVFYQPSVQLPPSDMILQILSSQLQSHFPGGAGMLGGANGSSNGSGDQVLINGTRKRGSTLQYYCMHLLY